MISTAPDTLAPQQAASASSSNGVGILTTAAKVETMSFTGKAIQRTWHLVDASTQTVGRLATQLAPILKGKHKPTYKPHTDCGDIVVIINAEKVCQSSLCPLLSS
jgi:hypothetical protein